MQYIGYCPENLLPFKKGDRVIGPNGNVIHFDVNECRIFKDYIDE